MHDEGCRIREHLLGGYRAITLEHAQLAVTVLPEKGAEIYAIVYKPREFDVLWKAPWGLHRPNCALAVDGGSEAAWMDTYGGGWQGIFPNGGDSCVYRQATLGFHGEASTTDWDYRCAGGEAFARIELQVQLGRSPFVLRREVSIERASLEVRVTETIANQSEQSLYAMWGHHPAFATEFLTGGLFETCAHRYEAHAPNISATARVAPASVHGWPLVTGKDGREVDLSHLPERGQCLSEMGYLSDFEQGRYVLTSGSLGLAAELCWDHTMFPHLWYWLEWGGSEQYPFYGRCRVAAFEPFSSIPGLGLARAIERGTALVFEPAQTLSTELCLRLYPTVVSNH
jgi:galactose mutarotase-like enzyme